MKKIYFIGDSLSADYNSDAYPQVGYAEIIRKYKADDVVFINASRQGCSTKSFIEQNRFKIVEDSISKDDLLIVQFGNNDEKLNDPLRYTNKDKEFLENLEFFYQTARKKEALCIFMTSPTRCTFEDGKIKDSHLGYPQAMMDFCKKNEYICVDLNELTINLYNQIGQEEALKYHLVYKGGIYKRFPDEINDTSHYNYDGAEMVTRLALLSLETIFPEYLEYFIKYEK